MTDWGEFQNDLAYDQYMEDRYLEDIAAEGVEAFSRERLQAYFLENPDVAARPLNALTTAKDLLDFSPSASLVFAAVSAELTVKSAILRPLVYGLVHNEALAGFVAQYAIGRRSTGWFDGLLKPLLLELADFDLSTYRRRATATTLWAEVLEAIRLRNGIVHEGESVSRDAAATATEASAEILHVIFPAVIQALDLVVAEDLRVGLPTAG